MMPDERGGRRLPRLVVLLAPLGALGLVAGYLAVETVRPGTFTAPRPETIAEAVVVGNGPRALEMMADGLDPNAPALVRAGMFDEGEYELTPMEAALLSQRLEIVRLLVRLGAAVSPAGRAACLARARLPEALPLLGLPAGGPPPGGHAACLGLPRHSRAAPGGWPVQARRPSRST